EPVHKANGKEVLAAIPGKVLRAHIPGLPNPVGSSRGFSSQSPLFQQIHEVAKRSLSTKRTTPRVKPILPVTTLRDIMSMSNLNVTMRQGLLTRLEQTHTMPHILEADEVLRKQIGMTSMGLYPIPLAPPRVIHTLAMTTRGKESSIQRRSNLINLKPQSPSILQQIISPFKSRIIRKKPTRRRLLIGRPLKRGGAQSGTPLQVMKVVTGGPIHL
ncbi:unnamed protein product, partial [Allacma fusca]